MNMNNRVLVVDDDPGVRDSFHSILCPSRPQDIAVKGAALFEETIQDAKPVARRHYEVALAQRGEDGVKAVEAAVEQDRPFACAFIDMKMPGIDGAETAKRVWAVDSDVKIVIVTAYSEYTPDEIIRITGRDDLFYLRKPFNPEEIRQFALVLTKQWDLERERESLSSKLEKANSELEAVNKNLQRLVEERTAQLIQAEKMASLGLLVAGVAHEINNPMAFVSSNLASMEKYASRIVELLSRYGELEDSVRQQAMEKAGAALERIAVFKEKQKIGFILADIVHLAEESLEGIGRVLKIVNDLKTFSRVDKGELAFIDVNETLDKAITIIRPEVKHKADIVRTYEHVPQIKCFPHKISQVFLNILINAAQAIDEKGTIEVVSRYVQDGRRKDDSRVEVKISDTGPGIRKRDLPKVFDPFFTTKPVGEGTGLGLSISYDIVKAHGGEITVESEKGKGTAFTIRLPLEARL